MTNENPDVIEQLFSLCETKAAPRAVIASIPHTGTIVPADIASQFANDYIASLPMTDWHLHELYDFLPALGVTTLAARYSRFVVDLNRPPQAQQLYPGRFETGLVATQTFAGEPIYAQVPDSRDIEERRLRYHAPYHERLASLLRQRQRNGPIVLLDLHSVISAANKLHGPLEHEIYLGDRDGGSAPPWLMELAADAFSQAGLSVSRNHPYKGGYTTAHYGGQANVYALQIEMCQRVYMDEQQPEEAVGSRLFATAKTRLSTIFEVLTEAIGERLEHAAPCMFPLPPGGG